MKVVSSVPVPTERTSSFVSFICIVASLSKKDLHNPHMSFVFPFTVNFGNGGLILGAFAYLRSPCLYRYFYLSVYIYIYIYRYGEKLNVFHEIWYWRAFREILVREFILPPRCKGDPYSFVTVCGIEWWFLTDVSGQPIGSVDRR